MLILQKQFTHLKMFFAIYSIFNVVSPYSLIAVLLLNILLISILFVVLWNTNAQVMLFYKQTVCRLKVSQ